MIDRNLICKETANYLVDNKCTTLFNNDNNFNETNPFMVICFACIKRYDQKEAQKISTLWNKSEFRHEVYRDLYLKKKIILNDGKNTMFVSIPKTTWNKFEDNNTTVNSEGRRSFLVEFCDYIGGLMREYKIKCWPKIKYNYLTKINGHKRPRYYWSGTYSCRDESCSVIFSMNTIDGPMTTFDDVLIEINWTNECKHETFEQKTYCSRHTRKAVAQDIAINGLGNVIANKIIEDYENNSVASEN